jgi:hypothetical protein
MSGTLIIRRHGHHRKGYHRESGVYVHPAEVPGVIFRARDRGLPGRGPRVITKLRKGAMTNQAVNLGYIEEGQTISDIPKGKMDDFARDLVRSVGAGRAMKMVNAQVVFRKNQQDGFKDKMLIAKDAIRRQSKVLKIKR